MFCDQRTYSPWYTPAVALKGLASAEKEWKAAQAELGKRMTQLKDTLTVGTGGHGATRPIQGTSIGSGHSDGMPSATTMNATERTHGCPCLSMPCLHIFPISPMAAAGP